ncbi:MAG TPA: hypothetical protein VLW52_05810 [Opitutaceae bacterium]|nr:hypothetical protein [Opitutaceae bacterium]HUJ43106.1 hypothetical protein [Opitutaceae bacterium]
MKDIKELKRRDSPAPRPQSLAWDGTSLWMGSIETSRLYAITPATWKVSWETECPGKPWGMTVANGELRVICGETADDHRIIRRCLLGHGFDAKFGLPCPDDCGSQLGWDGHRLHLSQWYPKKVLVLGAEGQVERVLALPHGVCGQVIVDGLIYLVTTDAEQSNDYWLTRVDPRPATPKIEDLARIPFQARALAWDGKRFWTNHRERHQIVAFAKPA